MVRSWDCGCSCMVLRRNTTNRHVRHCSSAFPRCRSSVDATATRMRTSSSRSTAAAQTSSLSPKVRRRRSAGSPHTSRRSVPMCFWESAERWISGAAPCAEHHSGSSVWDWSGCFGWCWNQGASYSFLSSSAFSGLYGKRKRKRQVREHGITEERN